MQAHHQERLAKGETTLHHFCPNELRFCVSRGRFEEQMIGPELSIGPQGVCRSHLVPNWAWGRDWHCRAPNPGQGSRTTYICGGMAFLQLTGQ